MFGEEELKGIKQLKLTKGQITLPEFTKAEPNENLYFLKLGYETRLYNEHTIQKLTDILVENYAKEHTARQLRDFKLILYALSIETNKVNSKRRLTIPQEIIEKQKFENNVVVVGANTHLKIFKDMKTYIEYKKNQKV